MTQISLRAYIREIDNLIDREHLDEAIAHCRHILQTYPKHIETYRLLGKAYLEAKRYGDAADIFQRVLSAIPDDFVSHIGMSIVREDEGNLDAAIWHMERGFETNPANPAIQQELRRLIGRRDGFEPHKVRLTRGALARMYAQGELYPQAIAELRSALSEDPERPDLQVLLATMYWQTDDKMEAAEVSSAVLEKLPFCQQAARVMAAVYQERGKSDEGTAYHRRLAQLDPYAAYVEYPMMDTVKVEADTIRIERLDWRPGQPLPSAEPGQPDWAASLGVEVETEREAAGETPIGAGPLPSWLDDIEPSSGALEIEEPEEGPEEAEAVESLEAAPALGEAEPAAAEEQPAEAADIPGWMREAGWHESVGEASEAPVSFSDSEMAALESGELPPAEGELPSAEDDETGEPELAQAEIPPWLQDIAPKGPASEADEEEPAPEPELETPAEPSAEGEAYPEWLDEAAEAPTEAAGTDAASAESDLFAEIQEAAEPPAADDGQEVPAWLEEEEPGATPTIMSWLGDLREEAAEAEESEESEEPAEAVPDWISEAAESEDASFDAPLGEVIDEAEGEEDAPGWLAGLSQAAADSEAAEQAELTELRAQAQAGAGEGFDFEEDFEPEAEAGLADEAEGASSVPDWLMSIAGQGPEATAEEALEEEFEPAAGTTDADEAEAWLDEFAAAAEDEEPAMPIEEAVPSIAADDAEEVAPEGETSVGWLEQLGDEDQEAWELPAESESPPEPAEASPISWLEHLEDEEMESGPTSAAKDEPEWMRGLDEEDESDEALGGLADTWLEGLADTLADTPAEPAAAIESPETGEVPDWLSEYEEPQEEAEFPDFGLEAPEVESPPPAPTADPQAERLEWLEGIGLGAEEAPSAPSEEIQPTDEAGYDVGQIEGMNEDQIFDWLESLADRDEAEAEDVEERPLDEAPAEAPEEPLAEEDQAGLDWLTQLSEQRGIDADIQKAPEAPPRAEIEPEPTRPAGPPTARPPETDMQAPGIETHEPAPTSAPEPPPAFDEQEPAPPTEAEPPSLEEAPPEPAAVVPPPPMPVPEPPAEEAEAIQPPMEAPPAAPEPAPSEEAFEPPDWLKAVAEAAAQAPDQEPASPVPASEPAEPPAAESDALGEARRALASAHDDRAAELYGDLIKERTALDRLIEDLEMALDQRPDSARLWQVLGDAYMKDDRTSEAVKAYNRGMKEAEVLVSARQALASGDRPRAAAQYGILIKKKKQVDAVITDLENALAQDDDQPEIWQTLGDAYMKADRLDEAIEAYKKGVDAA